MMTSLPQDILVRAFCFLGNVPDLASVKLVCKTFRRLADNESIWHDIAIRQFGPVIHGRTLHLYGNSSYEMIKDDNRLGACPILDNPGVCFYKGNRCPDYWFACLIRWVRWHLRQPITSGVWRQDDRAIPQIETALSRPEAEAYFALAFRPYVAQQGHYKGLLIYPEETFMQPREYVFCYANSGFRSRRVRGWFRTLVEHELVTFDYTETVILSVQGKLKDAFPEYSLEALTDDDTEESDRERWRLHVPPPVMDRQDPSPWWT
jgi:F-box-like